MGLGSRRRKGLLEIIWGEGGGQIMVSVLYIHKVH
jgi:hypothetical protein